MQVKNQKSPKRTPKLICTKPILSVRINVNSADLYASQIEKKAEHGRQIGPNNVQYNDFSRRKLIFQTVSRMESFLKNLY